MTRTPSGPSSAARCRAGASWAALATQISASPARTLVCRVTDAPISTMLPPPRLRIQLPPPTPGCRTGRVDHLPGQQLGSPWHDQIRGARARRAQRPRQLDRTGLHRHTDSSTRDRPTTRQRHLSHAPGPPRRGGGRPSRSAPPRQRRQQIRDRDKIWWSTEASWPEPGDAVRIPHEIIQTSNRARFWPILSRERA